MFEVFNHDFKNALQNAIRAKIVANQPFNKYELLLEVRKDKKMFYRYSEVRTAIEELINSVCEEENVELISNFVRNADGKVYSVYEQVEDDSDEDDSDEDDSDGGKNGMVNNDYWNINIDKRNRVTLPVKLVQSIGLLPFKYCNIVKIDDNTSKIIPLYDAFAKTVRVESSGIIRICMNSLFSNSNCNKVNAVIGKKNEITVLTVK